MNAAAKVINQHSVFHGHLGKMHVSKYFYLQMTLLFSVLFSALAIVYVTNLTRISCSQLQIMEQEAHQLQLQWGKLLLEQASLTTPDRVADRASDELHMILPANKQAFVLRSR